MLFTKNPYDIYKCIQDTVLLILIHIDYTKWTEFDCRYDWETSCVKLQHMPHVVGFSAILASKSQLMIASNIYGGIRL